MADFIIISDPDLRGNEQIWITKKDKTIIICAEEPEEE